MPASAAITSMGIQRFRPSPPAHLGHRFALSPQLVRADPELVRHALTFDIGIA